MKRTETAPANGWKLTSADAFARHRDRIYRYLSRLVRNPAEAQDLTQETFLRAHRQLESLRDPAALTTWLYRIATHAAYDRFRESLARPAVQLQGTERGEGEGDPDWTDPDAPRVDEAIERSEMSACVQELVEDLPDSYRAAILLHDLSGLRDREIAQMLGCSLQTVKIRLHRARNKLRRALAGGCEFSRDRRGVFVCERRPPGP